MIYKTNNDGVEYYGTNAERLASFPTLVEGVVFRESDTGSSYRVIFGTWVKVATTIGGGSFLTLSDTPASYSGQTLKIAQVNGPETALEFTNTPTLVGTNFTGIDHTTALTNVGTNTHAQIDTHIANTNNPHAVIASQVTIVDTGAIITATEVEGALQENRAQVNINTTDIGTNTTAIGLNTTHRTSDGSDHGFIDQSVISAASPTFVGTNFTSIPDAALVNDKVNVAGDTMTGQLFIDGSADQIQLIVQASATQTANLTEWQNSTGTAISMIDATGNFGLGITPSARFHISTDAEQMRLATVSATANPFFTFYQSTTRRGFMQLNNTNYNFKIASEYGIITLHTGTSGAEVERMRIFSGGHITFGSNTDLSSLIGIDGNADILQLVVQSHSIQTANLAEWQNSGGTALVTIAGTGGIQLGTPTGGDKGLGTINVAGDIYKNNAAYTNPDYVIELWATGNIKKYKTNPGAATYVPYTLGGVENYMRKYLRLPGISDNSAGMFKRADITLEKIEELFIHVIETNKRIDRIVNHLNKHSKFI